MTFACLLGISHFGLCSRTQRDVFGGMVRSNARANLMSQSLDRSTHPRRDLSSWTFRGDDGPAYIVEGFSYCETLETVFQSVFKRPDRTSAAMVLFIRERIFLPSRESPIKLVTVRNNSSRSTEPDM